MRWNPARNAAAGLGMALFALLANGCYEELPPAVDQSSAQVASPTPEGAASAGRAGTTVRDPARPSHGTALRAAHNTIDRLDEHQREIERALEDPQ